MMELYVLDNDYLEGSIIDTYESLIWTERFDTPGDFQLQIAQNKNEEILLALGTVLSNPSTNRMMVVEKIIQKNQTIEYSGQSLESLLAKRVGRVNEGSGSPKSWLNKLVRQTLIEGSIDNDDILEYLQMGLNRSYLPSTIPPSTDFIPKQGSGWYNLMDAHKKAQDYGTLGFRIVRAPYTQEVYYENYSGNDLSMEGSSGVYNVDFNFLNPYFFETDDDVEVWRNLSNNPGFTTDMRPLSATRKLTPNHDVVPKIVNTSWSKSGKGMAIVSHEDRSLGNSSFIWLNDAAEPLTTNQHGFSWYSKTITITAKVEIVAQLTGTQHASARRLVVYAQTSEGLTNNIWASSAQVPNSIGVHNVSFTFTLPVAGGGVSHWGLAAWNGNGATDEGDVIWGDFCVMRAASNPVGYFDSEHSPDPDLFPDDAPTNAAGVRVPVLKGRLLQGLDPSTFENCVVVQSRNWTDAKGGISARMINNTGLANHMFSVSSNPAEMIPNNLQTTRYQSEVLSGATGTFGVVNLFYAAALVAGGSSKPNVVGSSVANFSNPNDLGMFFRADFHGQHTKLGGSLYFDNLIITRNQQIYSPATLPASKPVIFSEEMDSFIVENRLSSIADHANIVYVTNGDFLLAVDDGYVGELANRRVIHVDADSLEQGPYLHSQMEKLGMKALAENRKIALLEGEAPSYSTLKYDVDYRLGDVVMVIDTTGNQMTARVMEQVFASTPQGYRSYPTLREETVTTIGVWTSPQYIVDWDDAEPLETWADQP